MQAGDVVLMTSCTVTNTCKRGAKDKITMDYRAKPNQGMVFLLLGSTSADKQHLLSQDGSVEAFFKAMGYVPDPELAGQGGV